MVWGRGGFLQPRNRCFFTKTEREERMWSRVEDNSEAEGVGERMLTFLCSTGVDILASLGHTGRSVVLGYTLNTLQHEITKKSHDVLRKFTILCWATFTAILVACGLWLAGWTPLHVASVTFHLFVQHESFMLSVTSLKHCFSEPLSFPNQRKSIRA